MSTFASLRDVVGRERSVRSLCQGLHLGTAELGATSVGAMHITCADESEHECVTAFQHGFAHRIGFSVKKLLLAVPVPQIVIKNI